MSRWDRFWDGFTITGARLAVFRFFFFSVLGLDCWGQIAHAPRYGAGGLNISHLPWLDDLLPIPEPSWMLGGYLLQAYLGFRLALGGSARFALPALAILWNATYFISQLDSYQHHYLVGLILVILCFAPWEPERPDQDDDEPRSAWAVRLLLVQLSIVYFWTAVAKLDTQWLSGETLVSQVSEDWVRSWVASAASVLGTEAAGIWSFAAVSVCLGELFVAFGLQVPRLRIPSLILGMSFHLGVEVLGFKIGLFSWFMLTMYLLLVPDRIIGALHGLKTRIPRLPGGAVGTPALGIALVAGAVLLGCIPTASPGMVIALMTGAALVLEPRSDAESRDRRALLHLLCCGILLLLHLSTDQVRDYYRYLGGDTRRRGDLITATEAYRQVVSIDPSYASGYYRLGDLLARQGQYAQAAAPLERARALTPGEYRYALRAAQVYDQLQRGDQALEAARAALAIQPDHQGAAAIVKRWGP